MGAVKLPSTSPANAAFSLDRLAREWSVICQPLGCARAGSGEALFRYAEDTVRPEAEYMVLSTATKNWKAIFHFYLDELDMKFWSARLYKKIGAE